jgi:signal transduction histidine kinase/DNA-binding response OmpR family regulator
VHSVTARSLYNYVSRCGEPPAWFVGVWNEKVVMTVETAIAELLAGDDDAAALHREVDWASSPLGPVHTWPEELVAGIRTVMAARIPMLIWWGPELVQIYNTAYQQLLGDKHPTAAGQRAAECWAEVWHDVGPMTEAVMRDGKTVGADHQLFLLERAGYLEETYWTFSYSPIFGPAGSVLGVFVATTEVTGQVLAARRSRVVSELGSLSIAESGTAEELCRKALTVLSSVRASAPFAAVYLRQGAEGLALIDHYGLDASSPALPGLLAEDEPTVSEALASGVPGLVGEPAFLAGVTFSPSPIGDAPVTTFRVFPLRSGLAVRGLILIGLTPYRAPDADYLGFLDLAGKQFSTALSDGMSYHLQTERAAALAELDEAKTSFLQNISHEFRTPLALIAAPLATVLGTEQEELSPLVREELELAERGTRRLTRLVDTLLDFVRAGADQLQAQLEPTDLAELTRDVTSMFRSVVEAAGLTLTVDTAGLDRQVSVDQEMYTKILLNLLSNAVKYTTEGGIAVSLTQAEDGAVLSVADTGLGIAPEHLSAIFDRFYRISTPSARSREGAGIGLSLVRDLAAAQGGTVQVQSTLGRGSTFTVTLAVSAADAAPGSGDELRLELARRVVEEVQGWVPVRAESEAVTPTPSVLADAVTSGTQQRRVLLVEDNADMRAYLVRLLSSDGWQVDAYSTAEEALGSPQVPDIVLCDIMLPGRSGTDLVRLMRADARLARVPAILITARSGSGSAAEGLAAGADDFIVKPFDPTELLARLRTHHELASLREFALAQAENKAANLESALASNRHIGMAIGIIMNQRRVTHEQAFAMLRSASQTRHRKLRDVADDILFTGDLANLEGVEPAPAPSPMPSLRAE